MHIHLQIAISNDALTYQVRLRISKEAPSVLVRLVDNQREGEMQDAATDPRMKSKVKIPHFVPSKYASAMGKEARGRKVYEKLKPKKVETFAEWRAQMAEQVSQASGVTYAKEALEASGARFLRMLSHLGQKRC